MAVALSSTKTFALPNVNPKAHSRQLDVRGRAASKLLYEIVIDAFPVPKDTIQPLPPTKDMDRDKSLTVVEHLELVVSLVDMAVIFA